MPSEHSNRIASLEFGRVMAMFAIILLHCHILHDAPLINEVPWVGYVINQLARFGVPFFFILSGYLIQPKLTQNPIATLKNYSQPLMKIWLVWSVICLLMPFNLEVVISQGYLAERMGYWGWLMQTPLNTLMEGGLVHLWFLPGLVCAVTVIALCIRFNAMSMMPYIAVGLYLYGVAGGSYGTLTEIWTPFFTRNGPFFSTLMVWIGFEIRRTSFTMSYARAALMAAAGLVIHFAEASWLYGYDVPFNSHDFLLGTSLWGTGLFMMLLVNPTFGNKPVVFKLASMVLGVYVAHLPIMIVLHNVAGALSITGYVRDLAITGGTLFISLIFVWAISRTPLQKVLIR